MLSVFVALVAAVLGGLWLWISASSNGEQPLAIDGRISEAGVPSTAGELPLPPRGAADGRPIADPTEPFDAEQDPLRFEGRGSIRGQVVVDPGVEYRGRFAVVVGPSRSLTGRERAASRRFEFPATTEEFLVDDLPLAGYDVWVEAERMDSLRTPMLLTRTAAHPYVILRIFPTGFIDGYVIHSDGSPAEEVKVAIERVSSKERRDTLTRADGLYRFDDVRDGEYRIQFGPPETPLVPPRGLTFRAPSLRFPDVTLPLTVDIRIHAQDNRGRDLAGVTISGFGDHGGRIDVLTDGTGLGWARHLPPGRYRVNARLDDGRKARDTLVIKDEPDQDFWLVLR